jgi:SAM-dependent methyltransferase
LTTLERADIESIEFGGHNGDITRVRGYQNYNVSDSHIKALENPTALRPWVDTEVKSKFFTDIFNDISPKRYVDFGCNLGYYVFLGSIANVDSVGIDYNLEYISVCNAIKARHKLKATFKHTNLENWHAEDNNSYDLLTVFNVIHHLYNRTEQYKNMDRLVHDFAMKSATVLFEFPTERDKKGHKWTMDTDYSQDLFESSLTNQFSTWKKIPGQTEERPYYLCNA